MAARLAASALALVGLAGLGLGLDHLGEHSADPDAVFAWYAGPTLLALLGAAFALLRPRGRLALASVLLAVAGIEAAFHAAKAARAPEVREGAEPGYYRRDAALGYAPRPGVTSRAWKRVEGERVYEVEYAFDAEGRRVTPVPEPAARDRFLLCFGGSFMFGEGLEGDETLPARLAARAPGHRPYNYAFRGYGPPQLLAALESGRLPSEVAERRGLLLYLFIDAHVRRAIGSLVVHTGWAHATPYYVRGPGGLPRRQGTLTTGRPGTALLFSLLGQSAALQALRIDWPPVRDRHVEWTARLLGRSAELFRRQLGEGRFAVAIYPGSRHAEGLAEALARFEVEVLDYRDLFDPDARRLAIAADRHPSALAQERLAAALAEDLGLARRSANATPSGWPRRSRRA